VKEGCNRFKEGEAGQDTHCRWIGRESTELADTKSID
jgi:hypothetical protein